MNISFQKFLDFLKDSNAESEFQKNYFEQNGGVNLTRKAWDEMNVPLEIVLSTMFDWDSTPEGRRFWQRIDNYFQRKFTESAHKMEESGAEKEKSSNGDDQWNSFFFG